jgi:hypothetical protein
LYYISEYGNDELIAYLDPLFDNFNFEDELYSIDKEVLYTGDWNMRGSSPVPPAQG